MNGTTEQDILDLLAKGHSHDRIAQRLGVDVVAIRTALALRRADRALARHSDDSPVWDDWVPRATIIAALGIKPPTFRVDATKYRTFPPRVDPRFHAVHVADLLAFVKHRAAGKVGLPLHSVIATPDWPVRANPFQGWLLQCEAIRALGVTVTMFTYRTDSARAAENGFGPHRFGSHVLYRDTVVDAWPNLRAPSGKDA